MEEMWHFSIQCGLWIHLFTHSTMHTTFWLLLEMLGRQPEQNEDPVLKVFRLYFRQIIKEQLFASASKGCKRKQAMAKWIRMLFSTGYPKTVFLIRCFLSFIYGLVTALSQSICGLYLFLWPSQFQLLWGLPLPITLIYNISCHREEAALLACLCCSLVLS